MINEVILPGVTRMMGILLTTGVETFGCCTVTVGCVTPRVTNVNDGPPTKDLPVQ